MRVDTYKRQEKLDPIRGNRLSAPEDRSGQYIAAGLKDWASVFAHWKDEADKTVIAEAKSKYIRLQQDRDYGENGFYKQQGMNAVKATDSRQESMVTDMEEVTKDMSGQQKAMFDEWALGYNDNQRKGILHYASGQAVEHANKEALSLAQTSLENAVANYNNPAMFAQATDDYDQSLLRIADLQGMEGEIRARYIASQRGKMTVGVVNHLLEKNPDNPWAAKRYFERAKKEGRADLATCEALEGRLRSAMDAATVRSLAAKFGEEIDAANIKENETNPDNPRDRSATIINRIMNDSSIPLRMRSQIAHAAATRAGYAKAARDEQYANLYSQVEEKMRSGMTVGEIPEFASLRPKDRDQLAQGVRRYSDPAVVLDFIEHPENVTVANVNAAASRLTYSDRLSFMKQAVTYEQAARQGGDQLSAAIDKARGDERMLEVAYVDMGRVSDLEKTNFKKSEEWTYARLAYNQLTRDWMRANNKTVVPEEVARGLAHQATRSIGKSRWYWSNAEKSEAVLLGRDYAARLRGETDDYVPVDNLVLTDAAGKEIADSDAIKARIIDRLNRAGKAITSANIVRAYRQASLSSKK